MESLVTLKQALDAGLISSTDYESGKTAFLRAQQIRSGFESGLLSREDYESVRVGFLSSLGCSAPPPGLDSPTSHRPAPTPAPAPRPGSAPSFHTPVQAGRQAAPPPSPAPPPPPPPPAPAPAAAAAAAPAARQSGGAPAVAVRVEDMTCMPGKSMSGISVTKQSVELYKELKSKSNLRFLTFKIDKEGTRVVPDQSGASSATFADFVDSLPDSDCRFAVYDFEYTNADGCLFKKIIFVMWSPDNAATKSKMMYASSKDFLKNLLPGIAVEQQATEKSEVDEEDMRLRIQATITRK